MFWSIWWCNVFVSFPHSTSNIIYPLKSRINNKINKFYILMYIFRSRIELNDWMYFLSKMWIKLNAKQGLLYTAKLSNYLFFFSAITQSKFSHLILWKQMFKKWMNEWRCFTGNCFYGRKPIKNTFVVPWKLSKVMKFLYMIMDNIS